MKVSNELNKQQTPFAKHFKNLTDSRRKTKGNFKHKLSDIIFLVISAVVSGSDDWAAIETFGKKKLEWLRKFGTYDKGVPSHDTIERVFIALETKEFSNCFSEWTKEISQLTKGEVIAIDGKRLRGSYDKESGKSAIHMVSAFASQNSITLGQVSCEEKSNEITAIPKLLDIIAIKGCIVTIDAMGCQKEIATKIIDKGADYLLAVKENQKELLEQIKKVMAISKITDTSTNLDAGHGRIEERTCTVYDDLRFLDVKEQWTNIKSVVKISTTRYTKNTMIMQKEERYYITSLSAYAQKINDAVRNHWCVENNLHWMLDVLFKEDASRKRKGASAMNYNIISKIALALLTKEATSKGSIKNKRYEATLDSEYREKVLGV